MILCIRSGGRCRDFGLTYILMTCVWDETKFIDKRKSFTFPFLMYTVREMRIVMLDESEDERLGDMLWIGEDWVRY